jgi:hypothetical protein
MSKEDRVRMLAGPLVVILLPLAGYLNCEKYFPSASPWYGAAGGFLLAMVIIPHALLRGRKALIYRYFFRWF